MTGLLRCPVCGAGMVISRTTNILKDGTRKRIVYYACGNWKNKGTAVCRSNSIRVEKANAVVYRELEKVFNNEKFLKAVMGRINKEHTKKVQDAEKVVERCEREVVKLENRKRKAFEAFEDELITGTELVERKKVITKELEVIEEQKQESLLIIAKEKGKDIPYEYVREILQNFSQVLDSDIDRGLKKQLLHMLIAEITMDRRREIDSIKLRLTDELIAFLNSDGGVPPDNGGASLFSYLKPLGISSLDLELVV